MQFFLLIDWRISHFPPPSPTIDEFCNILKHPTDEIFDFFFFTFDWQTSWFFPRSNCQTSLFFPMTKWRFSQLFIPVTNGRILRYFMFSWFYILLSFSTWLVNFAFFSRYRLAKYTSFFFLMQLRDEFLEDFFLQPIEEFLDFLNFYIFPHEWQAKLVLSCSRWVNFTVFPPQST